MERIWDDGRNRTYMTSECLPWFCPINGELTIAVIEAITGNIIFYEKQLYKIFNAFFILKKQHKLWVDRRVPGYGGSLS